MEEMLR